MVKEMTEEKRNRIIAAVTANVILLMVILIAVVIYQLVDLTVISRRKSDIKQQIEYYRTETEKNEKTLEYWQSYEGLLDKAYEFGFISGK